MESMLECQLLRQPSAPGPQPHPAGGHRGPGGLSMFRPTRPPPPEPAPAANKLSPEERALFIARTQLLRAQSPFSPPVSSAPFSPLSGLSPLRPPLAPHLGIQHLWSQWAQLQQLNSALIAQQSAAAVNPAESQTPAALFSNLLSQAQQRFSPYVISSPSPPPSSSPPAENQSHTSSRSQSPVQVET